MCAKRRVCGRRVCEYVRSCVRMCVLIKRVCAHTRGGGGGVVHARVRKRGSHSVCLRVCVCERESGIKEPQRDKPRVCVKGGLLPQTALTGERSQAGVRSVHGGQRTQLGPVWCVGDRLCVQRLARQAWPERREGLAPAHRHHQPTFPGLSACPRPARMWPALRYMHRAVPSGPTRSPSLSHTHTHTHTHTESTPPLPPPSLPFSPFHHHHTSFLPFSLLSFSLCSPVCSTLISLARAARQFLSARRRVRRVIKPGFATTIAALRPDVLGKQCV